MTNRKIWRLWKIFEEKEREHFPRFLEAELDDRQGYVQQLARWMASYPGDDPQDEEAWTALYPHESYDDHRLRKLSSDLAYWMEEYLAIQGFRKNRGQREVFLLKEFSDRDSVEDFVKTYKRIKREEAKRWKTDSLSEHFYHQYRIEFEKQGYLEKNRLNPGKLRELLPKSRRIGGTDDLSELLEAFHRFWCCEILNFGLDPRVLRIAQENPAARLFQQSLELIKKDPKAIPEPSLPLFYQLLFCPDEEKAEVYQEIFRKLREGREELPMDNLKIAFVILFNFFLKEFVQAPLTSKAELLLDILRWGIFDGFLLESGKLQAYYYRNLINLSIRTGKHSLGQEYLESLKPLLRASEQADAYHMAKANLLFSQNKSRELIRFLMDKKFKDPRLEIDARIRLLQANYSEDPGEEVWLFTQISNLQKFIRQRKNLPRNLKEQHLNFLRLFKLILKTHRRTKADRVWEQLKQSSKLPNKQWLEKILKEKFPAMANK